MKSGNSSMSPATIPNFYFTRNLIEVQAFKDLPKKLYFGEKRLFSKFKDLNLSHNPRNDLKKFEIYNKNKFKPANSLSSISYDFKDPSLIRNTLSHEINLKKMHEKKPTPKAEDPYSNDNMKREFANKIVGLIGNINNGDNKVKIINPIVKNQQNDTFIQKPPIKFISSSVDFNEIRSTITINFNHQNNNEPYGKIYENTVKDKFKKLKSLQRKEKIEENTETKEKCYFIKSIFPSSELSKAKEKMYKTEHKSHPIFFNRSLEQKRTHKNVNNLHPIQKHDIHLEDALDKINKDQALDGANLTSTKLSLQDQNKYNNKDKKNSELFDTSKFKSVGYNVFSERYGSDYTEMEMKYKVYFE